MRTTAKILLPVMLVAAVVAFWRPWTAEAVVAGTPCAGNVCTGNVVVGGQTVSYSYTQHVGPNGQFRLRLNGGVYNTSQMVSYIVSGLPSFNSWDKAANPVGGAIYLPEEEVNPGHTAYERRASTGLTSQIVDQVMSVSYVSAVPGAYTFNLTVIQNGASGGDNGLVLYVDAAAPTNADEGASWATVPGMDLPCSDGVDNDLDYRGDCADAQCSGKVGNAGSGALCQTSETTCNDSFDNDADGKPDCLDPDCNGRVGQPLGTALCQYPDESGATACGDGFDNDGDGKPDCSDNAASDGLASHACWKQSSYGCPAVENCASVADDDRDQNYSSVYDADPSSGANCQDYDCTGNAACPSDESKDLTGTPADAQCFDGKDNDLDHLFDCADPNCAGRINPLNTAQRCYASEFSLVGRYQMCANGFDDNGNGPKDCADTSCKSQFGNCGPCPTREDYNINACADSKNNDGDAKLDCADSDCLGKFARLDGAAYCAADENSDDLCSDGFDNDLDGLADCLDPGCVSYLGPKGQVCAANENTAVLCGDGLDNDGDGRIDCGDASCIGIGTCAAKTYTDAACQIIPSTLGPMAFTGNDPTILATVTANNHVSATDSLRFTGSAVYSSVTIVVGDNLVPANYYPYAAPLPSCVLYDTATMTTSVNFRMTAVAGHAIQIFNSAASVSGFDLTLRCPTSAVPTARHDYPISLSALKQPGDQPEYGDAVFYTALFEATPPVVSEIEPEGAIGSVIKVPFGGVVSPEGRRFRAVADDPGGAAPLSSGICHCEVELSSAVFTPTSSSYSTLADCYTATLGFGEDAALQLRGRAEDGAANVGAWSGVQNFTVNVTPSVAEQLTLTSSSPFVRDGSMRRGLYARFLTGWTDAFANSCDVYLRTSSGAIVNGPVGPTFSFVGIGVANELRCDQTIDLSTVLPGGLSDGTYFMTVAAHDGDTDVAVTQRRPLIICNHVPLAGESDPGNGCAYADFDGDGAAEGLYSTLYSTDPRACDNCVGLPNAGQEDLNANGIGDACEPTKVFGRCEVDREIICECDSNEVCDYPCPGPSLKPRGGLNIDPQLCMDSWGVCAYGGEICFNDPECPGPTGLCAGDGTTVCRRDLDCDDAGVGGPCTGNPDRCENMLYPWFQSRFGNIFSRSRISAPELPPETQFNATYCITAKDTISNFSSELCNASTDATARYTFPQKSNLYSTVLGRIDVAGLRSGKYGTVVNLPDGSDVGQAINDLGGHLAGKVLRVTGDAVMSAAVVYNDAANGSGTVFVDGGNLTINGNVNYEASPSATLRGLASLGFIVIDTSPTTSKGAIYIDRNVTSLVGAFYAEGQDGIWSVAPPFSASNNQLSVHGLMMAYQFHFNRSYKSMTEGAERITYDGRAIANPPPGFGDIGKALPRFTDTGL
jgi:hypothetical protein